MVLGTGSATFQNEDCRLAGGSGVFPFHMMNTYLLKIMGSTVDF